MNILLAEENAGDLRVLVEALRPGGYAMRVVPAAVAGGAAEKGRPDIAIVVSQEPSSAVAPVARAFRSFEDLSHRLLIAIVPVDTPAARAAAREAGADVVVTSTTSVPDLVEHVRSAERIVGLERKLRARVLELEGALRRPVLVASDRGPSVAATIAQPNRGGVRFLLTHAWTDVDELLGRMCSDYLHLPFKAVVGATTVPPVCSGARITLTDVENELALELMFLASPESARAIAVMFTGDADAVDAESVFPRRFSTFYANLLSRRSTNASRIHDSLLRTVRS